MRIGILALNWQRLCRNPDFNHYYLSAMYAVNGEMPYATVDAPLTGAGWERLLERPTNPPALLMISSWMGVLSPEAAWLVWNSLMFVFCAAVFWIMIREVGADWGRLTRILLAAMYFSALPVFHSIWFGQITPFIVFLIVLGWSYWRRGEKSTAALLWGLSIPLKFYTWPLLLFLIALREYKSAGIAFISGVLLAVLPLFTLGWDIYGQFYQFALPVIEGSTKTLPNNISIGGWFDVLASLLQVELPFILVSYVIPFSVIVALVFFVRRKPTQTDAVSFDFCFFAVALGAFFCAPVAWDHYVLIALPVLLFLYGKSGSGVCGLRGLVASWLLLCLYFPFPWYGTPAQNSASTACYVLTTAVGLLLLEILLLKSARRID
ncbi:MAG: DUF2029 domain-containing protein [Deltaproteobacteria bacterium]|nr:DUF2029 domain-containing protein [Deltaproteobacteria bacterium]